MNLHPSGCPVTPSLLRRFLADMENAPCPGDLSACLGRIEQLARQEEPLCLDLSSSWDFCMSAADDAAVSLRSCAPSVVSIDETGLMHALGSGIAKITARCVRAGRTFQAELVVRVNERQAAALPLSGAVLTASSTNPEHPLANLLNDDPHAFWQSDYLDRTQRMPQWLCVELPQETLISAVRCSPWRGHTRGAILRAAVSLSRDGVQFREVCRREWDESHVFDDRLFAFPTQPARFLRITVDWAVMHTGDSNAVSIAGLSLYSEPVVSGAPAARPAPRHSFHRRRAHGGSGLELRALPPRRPVPLRDHGLRVRGRRCRPGQAPCAPAGARSAQRYDHAAG